MKHQQCAGADRVEPPVLGPKTGNRSGVEPVVQVSFLLYADMIVWSAIQPFPAEEVPVKSPESQCWKEGDDQDRFFGTCGGEHQKELTPAQRSSP